MNPKALSDRQLLALLIGPKEATTLYGGRLTPLMVGEGDLKPHPKLEAALELTKRTLREELERGPTLLSSSLVREYLLAHFFGQQFESFVIIHLDNRHRVLHIEELFRGTIDGATVYPRELVRSALKWNAAACVFAHNHPSGIAEPSQSDRHITDQLMTSLKHVGIRVLDHLVVGSEEIVSFAEQGLL